MMEKVMKIIIIIIIFIPPHLLDYFILNNEFYFSKITLFESSTQSY
jgi:hypothetical protein